MEVFVVTLNVEHEASRLVGIFLSESDAVELVDYLNRGNAPEDFEYSYEARNTGHVGVIPLSEYLGKEITSVG